MKHFFGMLTFVFFSLMFVPPQSSFAEDCSDQDFSSHCAAGLCACAEAAVQEGAEDDDVDDADVGETLDSCVEGYYACEG